MLGWKLGGGRDQWRRAGREVGCTASVLPRVLALPCICKLCCFPSLSIHRRHPWRRGRSLLSLSTRGGRVAASLGRSRCKGRVQGWDGGLAGGLLDG